MIKIIQDGNIIKELEHYEDAINYCTSYLNVRYYTTLGLMTLGHTEDDMRSSSAASIIITEN